MTVTDERKLDPTVTETALFRLYRRIMLDHDRSRNRSCERYYCSHIFQIALMENGPERYGKRKSLKGAFEKGRAAYRAGEGQGANPYGNVATYHRGGRGRGSYRVSGWSRMYEWHWSLGWAWAEWMESDDGLIRVLAGEATPDKVLWEQYLNWLYDVRKG